MKGEAKLRERREACASEACRKGDLSNPPSTDWETNRKSGEGLLSPDVFTERKGGLKVKIYR